MWRRPVLLLLLCCQSWNVKNEIDVTRTKLLVDFTWTTCKVPTRNPLLRMTQIASLRRSQYDRQRPRCNNQPQALRQSVSTQWERQWKHWFACTHHLLCCRHRLYGWLSTFANRRWRSRYPYLSLLLTMMERLLTSGSGLEGRNPKVGNLVIFTKFPTFGFRPSRGSQSVNIIWRRWHVIV